MPERAPGMSRLGYIYDSEAGDRTVFLLPLHLVYGMTLDMRVRSYEIYNEGDLPNYPIRGIILGPFCQALRDQKRWTEAIVVSSTA